MCRKIGILFKFYRCVLAVLIIFYLLRSAIFNRFLILTDGKIITTLQIYFVLLRMDKQVSQTHLLRVYFIRKLIQSNL